MECRALSKFNIQTSLLGYGCMRFPTRSDGEIDEEKAERLLDRAIAAGVNYIDTAYPYHGGKSEPFVGKVLKKQDRSKLFLATKLPCWEVHSVEDAERIFQRQLERLQTDYIDFYLLHALSRDRWQEMRRLGIVEFCESLQKAGKIRYFGFSFHDEYSAFEEILTARDWDFCQIQFNYMDTEDQAGLKGYTLACDRGIPVVVMEPVKGGALANLSDDITARLRAARPSASTASWAMRFVGTLPGVKVILSGMTTSEQLEDNLHTFSDFEPLYAQESALIAQIAEIMKQRVHNGCTGCRYCMPCPAGVDIPRNFQIWNRFGVYGNRAGAASEWAGVPEAAKAAQCVKCGKCEAACPQKLEIRRDLAALQAELDSLRA